MDGFTGQFDIVSQEGIPTSTSVVQPSVAWLWPATTTSSGIEARSPSFSARFHANTQGRT